MARKLDNKYGYKLCNENKKVELVTNSLWLAELEKAQNENLDIYPVKTYFEYSKLWRGCPFRDYLSDFIKRRKK